MQWPIIFLRGVACELKNPYRSGSYEVEHIAILSPTGDLIGYEINGKMMRIKKMKLVPIMEDVDNEYTEKSL